MIGIKDIFALLGRFALPSQPVKTKRRPTGAALRNPADFHQSNRLEAAVLKRRRKAEKLVANAQRATDCWMFGREQHLSVAQICAFDQLYVAH